MGLSPGRFRRALASPAFWAYLALSALPPQILGLALGWGPADPGGMAAGILWWPADLFGRLAALRLLLDLDRDGRPPPEGGWRSPASALKSALAAEVLVSLRAVSLLLAGLVPCLALLAYAEPSRLLGWPLRACLLLLAGLGLVPAALYLLRRCLSPLELLRAPLDAAGSLDASARRLDGRLGRFLGLAWPWIALGWALDLASLGLPDTAGLLLSLPSTAAALIPLALAADL